MCSLLPLFSRRKKMNLKAINCAVNIRDNNVHVVRGIIKNDTGTILNLKLIDGTEAFDYTGYGLIVMNLLKPDGTFIVDSTGEHLQAVDAENGMLSIKLDYTQATILAGMHFITISLYANTETNLIDGDGGTVKVTTARINYYVEDNIDNTNDEEVQSQSQYPILEQIITQWADIKQGELQRISNENERVSNENERISNEAERVAAEAARADENAGIVARATTAMEASEGILELMEKIIHGEIHDYDEYAPVVVQSQMTAAIAAAMATIDGNDSVLKVKRGLESAIDAAAGELYFATDTRKLYMGVGDSEYVCINEAEHIMSASAPSDTSKIWIDTDDGNAIKFYDENEDEWVGTATATFG